MSPHPVCWSSAGRLSLAWHTFSGTSLQVHTHSKAWPRPFSSGPLCPSVQWHHPVACEAESNAREGLGWRGQVSSAGWGPSLSSVSPSICSHQSLKALLLEIVWLAGFYFSPLTKVVIKQFTHDCRKIRKCIPVPGGATPPAVSPPCLLCWNTLMCTHICPLCPRAPTAPDWLGAGFPTPRRCPALAWPSTTSSLWCWSMAG